MAKFIEVIRPDGGIDYVNERYDEIIANTPTEPDPLPEGFIIPTEEELTRNEWAFVRQNRDILLAQTDWTQTVDAPLDDATKAAWQTYRQALRDITETYASPDDVVFPDKP